MLSGKVNQVEALNECRFICLLLYCHPFLWPSALKYNIIAHRDPSEVGRAHVSSKSEPHWKSISLCFNVSPLCGIFHTCRSHLWSSGSHVGSNASSTGSHSGSGNLHWEPSGPAIWDSACPYMLVCFPVSVWDEWLCGGEMFGASISVGTQRNTWPWLTQTSTYSLSHTQFHSRVYYWVCVNVLLRGKKKCFRIFTLKPIFLANNC